MTDTEPPAPTPDTPSPATPQSATPQQAPKQQPAVQRLYRTATRGEAVAGMAWLCLGAIISMFLEVIYLGTWMFGGGTLHHSHRVLFQYGAHQNRAALDEKPLSGTHPPMGVVGRDYTHRIHIFIHRRPTHRFEYPQYITYGGRGPRWKLATICQKVT